VSADGQRVLVSVLEVDQVPPSPITVVLNWTAAVASR
jgi:hypothetical protein